MGADDRGPQSDSDRELRRELHASAREELLKRQFSNSESYDKAILTLSSGFLALSLTFIKGVLPPGEIRSIGVLYASWIVLSLAIICTVLSFRISDAAINRQLVQIDRYYEGGDEDAATRGTLARWVDRFNNGSGALFIFGIVLTVAFVISNFSQRFDMSNTSGRGPRLIQEGQTVPDVQKIENADLKRGQSIPQVQKVPQSATNAQPVQPATSPVSPSSGSGTKTESTQKR